VARCRDVSTLRVITTRHLLYWLAGMVSLLVVAMTIDLIWADTSDAAGAFAGVTTLMSVLGTSVILIVLVFRHTRPNNPHSDESPK
jgi:multisubunit Na+/H+ antiporter MnhB subunit